MPVEIRELQITAVVQDAPAQINLPAAMPQMNSSELIAQCVEQVLEILKQKNER